MAERPMEHFTVDGVNIFEVTDAKARQDVSNLKDDLTAAQVELAKKANTDGYYEEMTVGNAEQLVSTVYEEDSVPYIFRTAGGSMDIGDREEDMLVGGSVVWNQLAYSYSMSAGTVTESDGIVTITPSSVGNRYLANGNGVSGIDVVLNHIYLQSVVIKSDGSHQVGFQNFANPGALNCVDKTNSANWTTLSQVAKATASGICYVQLMGVTDFDYQIKKNSFVLFDLTQMFGSTIADYIYSLETATAGAGVAWLKKHFGKIFNGEYIPHNPGQLVSVEGLSEHNMTGLNQWNEQWEVGSINATDGSYGFQNNCIRSKDFCKMLPDTDYYIGCSKTDGGSVNKYYLGIAFYDANKTFISGKYQNRGVVTSPSNTAYFKIFTNSSTVVYGATYNHDICINFHWDGERDGEYEPYVKRSYPLDSSLTLRGIPKLDSANNLYYDGDTYESDGTVTRRYGVVDLGTLNWSYLNIEDHKRFVAPFSSKPASRNLICTKYQDVGYSAVFNNTAEGISIHTDGEQIAVYDTAYTDATAFKTAMSGVYLVYELVTPTTETAEPYQNPQIVDDFGTEEYVTTSIVPVGHVTKYQPNLRAKLEMSPDSPDGDGDYIVRQANGENSYVSLASTTTIQDILARLTALEGNTNEG